MINQKGLIALASLAAISKASQPEIYEQTTSRGTEEVEEIYLPKRWSDSVFPEPANLKTSTGSCTVSKDCSNYPYYVCDADLECVHKDVFPQEPLEIVGIFVFGFIMALCTVAGIGGGGIALSMLMAFFKFDTKPAVAISSFSILVCTTMRYFYNFRTRNPEKPQMNVLDYGLASLMMPTTLAGSQIGGYILIMFPALYIQVALTLLLAFLTWQTTKKGLQLNRKEKAAKALKELNGEKLDGAVDPLETEGLGASTMTAPGAMNKSTITASDMKSFQGNIKAVRPTFGDEDEIEVEALKGTTADLKPIQINDKTFYLGQSPERDAELLEVQAIAKREGGQWQIKKQGMCIFIITCVILMNILLASKSQEPPIGVTMCSGIYWTVEVLFIVMCALMTWLSVKINANEQKLKMKYGVNY